MRFEILRGERSREDILLSIKRKKNKFIFCDSHICLTVKNGTIEITETVTADGLRKNNLPKGAVRGRQWLFHRA